MKYVLVPVYTDDDLIDVMSSLPEQDYHVLSDSDDIEGVLHACLPTTISFDEQLVLNINRELAKATARACADRATAKWGYPSLG